MRELTKAEEQIMHILWKLEKAFVREILDELPEPKPAYNTVSTVVRILQEKGFVSFETHGKSHKYYPTVAKEQYSDFFLKKYVKNYFGGSFNRMVSFFVKKNDIDLTEFEELMKHLEEEQPPGKEENG